MYLNGNGGIHRVIYPNGRGQNEKTYRNELFSRLELFLEVKRGPDTAAAIGKVLRDVSRNSGVSFKALTGHSDIRFEQAYYILAGVFRYDNREDMNIVERLANSLNKSLVEIERLAEETGGWENNYGSRMLFDRLYAFADCNRSEYSRSINIGIGTRKIREHTGNTRRELSAKSEVQLDYIKFLEHLFLPEKFLNGKMARIACAMGTTIAAVEKIGNEVRMAVGDIEAAESLGRFLTRVKGHRSRCGINQADWFGKFISS